MEQTDADFVNAAYSIAQLDEQGGKLAAAHGSEVVAELDKLNRLNGAEFDREFVAGQLAAHKRAVAMLQRESTTTKDPALKQQVDTELPAVQAYLNRLTFLSGDLGSKQG